MIGTGGYQPGDQTPSYSQSILPSAGRRARTKLARPGLRLLRRHETIVDAGAERKIAVLSEADRDCHRPLARSSVTRALGDALIDDVDASTSGPSSSWILRLHSGS
jgi:hypothetical protein